MAESTGKYSGIQYRPLTGVDVSDWITKREDQMLKFREEQRTIEESKAKAKAEKDKAFKEAHEKAITNNLSSTGSDTLDGTFADVMMIAREEMHKLKNITEDDNASPLEKSKAYTKISNLNNVSDRLMIMANSLMTEKKNYDEMLNKDEVWKDEQYESRFKDGYKGITISLDDNMNPVSIFRSLGEDKDNDGVIDTETINSLADVNARPQFIKKYNRDDLITTDAGLINAATQDDIEKGIKTTELMPSVGIAVDKLVQTRLYGNTNAGPSPIMISLLKDYGYNPEEVLKLPKEELNPILDKIEEDYKDALNAKLNPGIKKVEATQNLNLNRQIEADRAKQNKDQTPKPTQASITEQEKNNSVRNTVDGILAGDSKYLTTLKNTKLQEQGSDGKDIIIEDVEYSDGKIKIYLSGNMNGKDYIDIDTTGDNRNQAIGEVLKLIDPAAKPYDMINRYDKGEKTDREIQPNTNTKRFQKPMAELVNKMDTKADAIASLKKNGITGFTESGNYFQSKIKGPDGTEFNLSSPSDKKKLIQYLIDKKDKGGEAEATTENKSDVL